MVSHSADRWRRLSLLYLFLFAFSFCHKKLDSIPALLLLLDVGLRTVVVGAGLVGVTALRHRDDVEGGSRLSSSGTIRCMRSFTMRNCAVSPMGSRAGCLSSRGRIL